MLAERRFSFIHIFHFVLSVIIKLSNKHTHFSCCRHHVFLLLGSISRTETPLLVWTTNGIVQIAQPMGIRREWLAVLCLLVSFEEMM
jgi:hypothetical protein